jgi:hypothetical protein
MKGRSAMRTQHTHTITRHPAESQAARILPI